MINEITNFRNFRSHLSGYMDRVLNGENIAVKSKNREVVLISLEEYNELTGDETKYLLSTEANKKHLMEGIRQVEQGETMKVDIDELFN